MKVLIVYAHPDPKSLNASFFKLTVEELEGLGHDVKTSDLYAMKWKSQLDLDDFPAQAESGLPITYRSGGGYMTNTLTQDVKTEQEKLNWADLVIFQFPIWWFSFPAILKGWIDRVYSAGYTFGVGYSAEKPHGERYGEGVFKGKRAMLSITVGGPESCYSQSGISGDLFDILFPIQHGILFYPGFDVLPPFVAYNCTKYDDKLFAETSKELRKRLKNIKTTKPIPFRPQNGGDYDMVTLQVKDALLNKDVNGLKVHLKATPDEDLNKDFDGLNV